MLFDIEKLVYGGDGLARLPADSRGRGKAVFIPFVLAGEKIEATISLEKPGFARAEAAAVVEPSPYRVSAPCPHFGKCGGCHYQHATYEHQLAIKQEILRESLRRIAKVELSNEIEIHASPAWNYRNRTRLQVRTRPDFAAGYFKFASHDLLPVEECPISSPLINRGIAALWRVGRERRTPEGLREVEFFAGSDSERNETSLLIECLCTSEARRSQVRDWAEELCAAEPRIAGVSVFREVAKGGHESLITIGASSLIYQSKTGSYRVSAGAFFQTNRFLLDELVKVVTGARSGEVAMDLYAGVGLFSTALARDFRHIICVESSQTAAEDLAYNLPDNGKAANAAVEHYLAEVGKRGRVGDAAAGPSGDKLIPRSLDNPELIVVDPPRSGLGGRVTRLLAAMPAKRLTYVSCDPATLARDLMPFLAVGYRIEQAHLIDLFPQTFHLESVLHLVR